MASLKQALDYCAGLPSDPTEGQLCELAHLLGPLATLWLSPKAITECSLLCNRRVTRLPQTSGTCIALFAVTTEKLSPPLRKAVPLPLVWLRGKGPSKYLSDKLIDLSQQVLDALEVGEWFLDLHPDYCVDGWTLGPIDDQLEVDSAWAALAAGLELATQEGRPDTAIWATGSWDPRLGIREVGYLEEKIVTAADFGVKKFFVPASQKTEAEKIVRQLQIKAGLEIGTLTPGTLEARQAIAQLRDELDLPPQTVDDPDACSRWYVRQSNREKADRYYQNVLLPEIARRLRLQWEKKGILCTHVVTILSGSTSLAFLAAKVTSAKRCLILHTKAQGEKSYNELQEDIKWLRKELGENCELTFQEFETKEDLIINCPKVVESFVTGTDPEKVVLDLTPGTKEMTLALALSAAKPGNRLLYIRHERASGGRPRPFTEKLVLWPNPHGN